MPTVKISSVIATQEVVDAFRAVFTCKRCGACCTIFEGIKLTKAEAKRLPVPQDVRQEMFELFDGTFYLKEPCPLYDAGRQKCTIYNERPETCRNFPLHNQRCDDGHVHLGVAEMCPAALEALVEVEVEWLGR